MRMWRIYRGDLDYLEKEKMGTVKGTCSRVLYAFLPRVALHITCM